MPLSTRSQDLLAEHRDIVCCPKCGQALTFDPDAIVCVGCGTRFGVSDNIPLLFEPHEWEASSREAVTSRVRAFYEETPFPNYDEFDNVGSLIDKARRGIFAKMLDDQVPPGSVILECGCGTGQLSNFLSVANRTVFGTDICLNSLRLAQGFKERNGLTRCGFVQMNLFRPVFKPDTFDLVISNGVLHSTPDPFGGFKSIARLVKPRGYILIGLYHRYGRLITDLRRLLFRLTGDRWQGLDPNLRRRESSTAKKRAWFMDQYKHPLESKHTIGETSRWLEAAGFSFVKSLPRSVPFSPITSDERVFEPERLGNPLERFVAETSMILSGSREGGFFTIVGRKNV